MVNNLLLVFVGGGLGSSARYLFQRVIPSEAGLLFPWATLLVNIIGCFVIGIIWGLHVKAGINNDAKLFLMTGLCGGFTTFSTFSAENFQLLKSGAYLTAAGYIFASITMCIVATFIGFKIINN